MSIWTKTVLTTAAFAAVMISPAMAFQPAPVPEPEILSVFAASGSGALGIYLVRKWFKRK